MTRRSIDDLCAVSISHLDLSIFCLFYTIFLVLLHIRSGSHCKLMCIPSCIIDIIFWEKVQHYYSHLLVLLILSIVTLRCLDTQRRLDACQGVDAQHDYRHQEEEHHQEYGDETWSKELVTFQNTAFWQRRVRLEAGESIVWSSLVDLTFGEWQGRAGVHNEVFR